VVCLCLSYFFLTVQVSKQSIGVAYVKFWSGRDANAAYDACNDAATPIYVDSHKISATWAKKDASSSSSYHRSSPAISMSEIQQQIDWATASAQKLHHANAQGLNGFVLVPSSGYYYHAQSQVYYDPTSQLFYNCTTQAYYRWDPETNSYVAADGSGSSQSTGAAAPKPIEAGPVLRVSVSTPTPTPASTTTSSTVAAPTPQQAAPVKPSCSSVKFSILGKKQCKDMDRWNRKKVELAVEEAKAEEAKDATGPAVKTKSAVIPVNDSNNHQGGIRPRLYVSYPHLACLLCQRKFKDERHLSRHELGSTLHKQNLSLDEYEQVQRLEKSAASLGIELQPKTGGPPPIKKKYSQSQKRFHSFSCLHTILLDTHYLGYYRPNTAVPSPAPVPVPVAEPESEPAPFDESNVGNRLLQSMGWKQGEGLGKNGTGITENVMVLFRDFSRCLSAAVVALPIMLSG
jgi:RNA-binding protein 5/10